MDYSLLSTLPSCCADFALVPIGTGNPSIAAELAEVQRYLKSSGLKHTMHSTGTMIEGSWDGVMTVIGKAHAVVHQRNVARVQSTVTGDGEVDPVEGAA
ncbi:YkoF-like protein [Fusarium oxysporum]|nr:YkoF-like protein [Fusarium oxysporum]